MQESTTRRRKGRGETMPPLSRRDKLEELLKIQLETFPQKDLTAAEIYRWDQDLKDFPIEAVEYAFDSHRRCAMFFPVPGQIIDICQTWAKPEPFTDGCASECKSRHGKGYNGNDMVALAKLYFAKSAELKRPLTEEEQEQVLVQLNTWRGSEPDWWRSQCVTS